MHRRRLMQRMIMMGGKKTYAQKIIATAPIVYWRSMKPLVLQR